MRRFRKVVAIDFDGVIHRHAVPWTAPHEINDGPVPGVFAFIEQVLGEFDVAVFSARAADARAREAIVEWLLEQWPPLLRWQRFADGDAMVLAAQRYASVDDRNIVNARITVTARKPHAFLYIDDRGWRFEGSNFPTLDELRAFAKCDSWTKRALS